MQLTGANYDLDPPRRDEADWIVEPDASRRPRRARRALAQRRESRRVRVVESRLGATRTREQVQGLPALRARAARTHRASFRRPTTCAPSLPTPPPTRTRRRSTGGSPRRTTPSSERCIGSTRSATATSQVPRRQSNPRVAVSGLRVAGVPEESTVRRVHARADRRRLTLASPVGTLRGDGDSAFTTDGSVRSICPRVLGHLQF